MSCPSLLSLTLTTTKQAKYQPLLLLRRIMYLRCHGDIPGGWRDREDCITAKPTLGNEYETSLKSLHQFYLIAL
jgi:hypothetical protein